MDASNANDEGSSSEESAAELSEESAAELSKESAAEPSEESAAGLSEESAIELSEESAVELSNEGSSSSEESDDDLSQLPLVTLQAPPLDFPASPALHEAVSDDGFNMEGYNQQSDIMPGWYTTEEEV